MSSDYSIYGVPLCPPLALPSALSQVSPLSPPPCTLLAQFDAFGVFTVTDTAPIALRSLPIATKGGVAFATRVMVNDGSLNTGSSILSCRDLGDQSLTLAIDLSPGDISTGQVYANLTIGDETFEFPCKSARLECPPMRANHHEPSEPAL